MSDLFKDHKPRLTEEEDRRLWERVRVIPEEVGADEPGVPARPARSARREPWWRGWFALPGVRYGVPALAVALVAVVWVLQRSPTPPVPENAPHVSTSEAPEGPTRATTEAPSTMPRPGDDKAAGTGAQERAAGRVTVLREGRQAPPAPEAEQKASAPMEVNRVSGEEAAPDASGRSTFARPPQGELAPPAATTPAPARARAKDEATRSEDRVDVTRETQELQSSAKQTIGNVRGGSANEGFVPGGTYSLAGTVADAADVGHRGPLLAAVGSAYDAGVVFVIAVAADAGARLDLARGTSAAARVLAGETTGEGSAAGAPGAGAASGGDAGYHLYKAQGAAAGRVVVVELAPGTDVEATLELDEANGRDLRVERATPASALREGRVRTALLAVELARALPRTDAGRRARLEKIRADALFERTARPADAALATVLAECERALSAAGR